MMRKFGIASPTRIPSADAVPEKAPRPGASARAAGAGAISTRQQAPQAASIAFVALPLALLVGLPKFTSVSQISIDSAHIR